MPDRRRQGRRRRDNRLPVPENTLTIIEGVPQGDVHIDRHHRHGRLPHSGQQEEFVDDRGEPLGVLRGGVHVRGHARRVTLLGKRRRQFQPALQHRQRSAQVVGHRVGERVELIDQFRRSSLACTEWTSSSRVKGFGM